jgi:hypothetical protein
LAAQHKKHGEFANSEVASANLFFLLVDTFLKFAQNSSEKWQAATCHLSEEFHESQEKVMNNRKKESKIQSRIVHTLVTFKRVLRTKAWCRSDKELIIRYSYYWES